MRLSRKSVVIAVIVNLVLMGVGAVVARAAPTAQPEPVRMSFPVAVAVGILYYLAWSPWFANLGFTVLYRPLVAGALVGRRHGTGGGGHRHRRPTSTSFTWGGSPPAARFPGGPGLAGYLGTALALGAGWTSRRLWRWRPRWACWAA